LIPDVAPGEARPFPRQYRLTKTDEYSSVFGFRRAIRGEFFLLHYGPRRPQGEPARLGLVIGKKFLKLAVQRNLIKRIAREQFRLMQPDLPARDLIFRLAVKLKKVDRHLAAAEVVRLLGRLHRDGSGTSREQTAGKPAGKPA